MKHAVKRMMVILAACGVLAGGFLACQNDVESPVAYYTVSFNSDGGSFVAAQSVQSGKTAVEPKSPTKEAYTFEGWRKDGAAFDFATPITADTTLIAAWQAVKPETPRAEEGATESLDDTPADTTPSDKDNTDDSDNNDGGNADGTGEDGDAGDNGNTDGTGDNGDTGNNGNNGGGNADNTGNTDGDDNTGTGSDDNGDNTGSNDNNTGSGDNTGNADNNDDDNTGASDASSDDNAGNNDANGDNTDNNDDNSGTGDNDGTGDSGNDDTVPDTPSVIETTYTVKHLLQNVTGDAYAVDDTDTLQGIVGEKTNATERSYPDFTAQSFEQVTIDADGNTVVEIRYNRNVYTVYYEDGIDGEDITVPASATYRVGETVTLGTVGKRTSYTFMHWKDASGTTYASGSTITMGGADITLTAVWNFAGVLITENDTEAEINEKIKGMTTSGVVKVTGYMPRERLMLIDVTLQNYHRTDSVYIDLDISGTTGLTSLLGDYKEEFAEEATSIFGYPYWEPYKAKYRSIALPKQGLTKIETAAFYCLGHLESVIIPDGVTSIDDSAFGWCQELKNITIPDGVTSIGEGAFHHCDALESVVIPDSVKTIGKYAFSTKYGIREVTIGAGVEEIGHEAFFPTDKYYANRCRITFKNTTGWHISDAFSQSKPEQDSYSTIIDASKLADPENAWWCLGTYGQAWGYAYNWWKRFPDSGE